MQEPHVCLTSDVGEEIKLSTDVIFKVKSTNEKVKYEWSVDDKKIKENDDCYKISDTGVLSIQEFEKKYEGKYVCTLSTASKPVMSLSTQVQVNLKGKEMYMCLYTSVKNAFVL